MGEGCHVRVINRDRNRGCALVDDLGVGTFYDWDDHRRACAGAGLVVNATSLGMRGGTMWEETSYDWREVFSSVSSDCIAYDLVYVPLETSFLRFARDRGLACVDGLWMLLYQAVPACLSWFGIEPDVDEALRRHVLADIVA